MTDKTVVSIDVEESGDAAGNVEIIGSLAVCLEALYSRVATVIPPREPDVAKLDSIRAKRFGPDEQLEPQASFTRAIRSAMPDDGVLVQA
ncbi:MAG: hypothetical protein O3A47_01185 [Chloroflexi bacterium]|nr:hypothetical protein [Chloroflexota bacterium]